jgi:hypothetical protein
MMKWIGDHLRLLLNGLKMLGIVKARKIDPLLLKLKIIVIRAVGSGCPLTKIAHRLRDDKDTTVTTMHPHPVAADTTVITMHPHPDAADTTVITMYPHPDATGTTVKTMHPHPVATDTTVITMHPHPVATGTTVITMHPHPVATGTTVKTMHPHPVAADTTVRNALKSLSGLLQHERLQVAAMSTPKEDAPKLLLGIMLACRAQMLSERWSECYRKRSCRLSGSPVCLCFLLPLLALNDNCGICTMYV